jgi:hypothetical protein
VPARIRPVPGTLAPAKREGGPMTEAEWLTCLNPEEMLRFLRDRASER